MLTERCIWGGAPLTPPCISPLDYKHVPEAECSVANQINKMNKINLDLKEKIISSFSNNPQRIIILVTLGKSCIIDAALLIKVQTVFTTETGFMIVYVCLCVCLPKIGIKSPPPHSML